MSVNGTTPVEFVYKPPAGRNSRKASQILVEALNAFLGAHGRESFKAHPALNAAVSDVLNGKPLSLHRENELRRFLAMEPEREVTVRACPTHGIAHVVDCAGCDGTPAWLEPGQQVTEPRRARQRSPLAQAYLDGFLAWYAVPENEAAVKRCWRFGRTVR